MEEFEPFHWYITDQSAKTFLVTLGFFVLSILLLIFLFLRFARAHANTFTDIIAPSEVRRGRRISGDDDVSVVVEECSAGVDVEVIKRLPVFMHRLTEGSGDDNTAELHGECCICLGFFEENEIVKVMPECLHAFHSHCIDRWLTSQSTCPLCRSSVYNYFR